MVEIVEVCGNCEHYKTERIDRTPFKYVKKIDRKRVEENGGVCVAPKVGIGFAEGIKAPDFKCNKPQAFKEKTVNVIFKLAA